ncbi:sugar transferase [Lacisediminihabitans changchengi]|uniref:sugar transferase n=1 Tax=Lacisediminihabitans changchengi TaxID=2787634 RepID=UPI0027DD4131|nr:sugar transferase [Lacisediminihabitans changchengi]
MTDLLVVVLAVYGSQLLWFGLRPVALEQKFQIGIGYNSVSIAITLLWMFVLSAYATRDLKVIGSGTLEYRRVVDSTIRLFGIFAIVAFLLRIDLARGYFLTALPIGVFLLLWTRWAWRQWLRREQARGLHVSRAIVVGERVKSENVTATIRRAQGSGINVVGALTRDGSVDKPFFGGVPVLGKYADILVALEEVQADTVVLTGADEISHLDMRKLGWDLEGKEVTLIVAPGLTGVAGPRIHARPVSGLPLIYVEYPAFTGVKRLSKRAFDLVGAGLIILISSPVLIAVGIAIKTSSPGSILYRQERIGLQGTPFGMLKFRSMIKDADDQLESLLDAQGRSAEPLFKVMNDPRITRVGGFLRRSSLDEFPQLFNVLLGHMSLVGPRPQRQAEVALYDDAAHRRLMMKPGMSGLWQVSGRSNLSWDDAIRLDLYYVENWSMTGDIIILWRTIRAVAMSDGAV